MKTMKDYARAENRAVRRSWGQATRQIEWPAGWPDDPSFRRKMVPRVMACMRAGLGVEDMQATGTCKADTARQIIAWMRENGSLERFYSGDGK